jgi:hypothetical protein
MRNPVLFLICASIANCTAADMEAVRETVSLGKDGKGTFISTNRTSSPFYLIATNLDLASMIGRKRDTNLISSLRFALITQYVPSMERTNGGLRIGPGYYLLTGRYAELLGRTLTLTDFEMEVSANDRTRGEILSVHSKSLAFQVAAEFAAEAEKSRSTNYQPKR